MISALVLLLAAAEPSAEVKDPRAWHRLVAVLQYLEGDYANAVGTHDKDELAEQRGLAEEASAAISALGEPAAGYRAQMDSLKLRIDAGEDPKGVVEECGKLAWRILDEQRLPRAPKLAPDFKEAARLWTSNCAVCHGPNGDGQTAVGAALTPKPFNFHDAEKMQPMSPYRAFNTIGFGVKGTSMAPFPQLSETERWALAFYVFTFRQPACDHPPKQASLELLADSNDDQLAAALGPAEVACARHEFPAPSADLFAAARKGIATAKELYAKGQHPEARKAIVDAYLEGIEPVEPLLKARDPSLVKQIELGFTKARVAADKGERFEEEVAALLAVLDRSPQTGANPGSFWSVFLASFLILLREGFEALVVVGALLAVLKKMNAEAQARVVYLAVVAALISGGLALAFAQKLLAGANREWLETIVAFFAVAMLLYAALWLNQRSTMSAFMTELRGQMQNALGSGSNLGLFTVAYTAVARESFETALFVEGLAGDSPKGALWGAAAGLVGLSVMVVVIRRVGFVLPMKTLFNASTALLLATAVMVLGKGLHGLQEVGVLTLMPIPFVEIDPLGIFPDALSLVPQLLLGAAAFWWWRRSIAPKKAVAA